jgi:hypothetical protein
MVELELPKLQTWVRFPSPAPTRFPGHKQGFSYINIFLLYY